MDDRVLVTGGTGTLGRAVVHGLTAAGRDPVVLSRRPSPPAGMSGPYGWQVGDLESGAGIDQAVASAGTVIHCASSNSRRDVAAARTLIAAARRAGTPHLVYISIVGIDRVPLAYYRAKLEVERLIEDSRLGWSIVRATQFHEFVLRFFTAQRFSPALLVPAGMRVQPIAVDEVADRMVELAIAGPAGRVPDMAGPQLRSVADLARVYLHSIGSRRPVVPVPISVGRVMRGFRDGGHLAPENAVGRVTFEEFLAEQAGVSR